METDKLNLLTRAMTAYTWRMQSLATNVANLDTPEFQRREVSFEDELQQARQSTVGRGRQHTTAPQVRIGQTAPQLETELMEIADTQMRAQLASRAIREHYNLVNTGITGRSG